MVAANFEYRFMHMRFRVLFLLVLFTVVTASSVGAQLRLTAIPSKTIVKRNETFQLQFVAEGAAQVDEFIPPSFRNFEVAGEPLQSSGWTWVNGSLTEYVSYTYQLQPKLAGKLPIASAIAKMKGRAISSNPLVILVTDGVAKTGLMADEQEQKPDYFLAPGENAKEKIAKNLFVRAVVDKQTCVVGEPVLASFKLYTRLDSESKIVKRPSFNGFSVVDLAEPETGTFSKELYNGVVYNTYLIRQVQLFPLQAGDLTIEPVEIENRVRFIRALPEQLKRDSRKWMDVILEQMKRAELTAENIVEEQLVVQTPVLTIQVNELPEANKPISFTGAVGTFKMEAVLAHPQIRADENGVLKITIAGSGNLNLLTVPVIRWPEGIDVFEPRSTEHLETDSVPLAGKKVFEISFSAAPGTYMLPSVEFSFFDAAAKKYQVLQTDSLSLKVLPSNLQQQGQGLKLQQQDPAGDEFGYSTILLVAGLLLPAIAITLFLFYRRKRGTVVTEPLPAKEEIPTALFLRKAEEQLLFLNVKDWCSLLMRSVQDYFSNRMADADEQLGVVTIVRVLREDGYGQLADALQQLSATCEAVVYSPVTVDEQKDAILAKAHQLLEMAEQQFSLQSQTGNQPPGPTGKSGDSGYLPRNTSGS